MVSLKNIITHILQAHGFEVYERDGVLFAESGENLVSVGLFDNITLAEVRKYAQSVSGAGGRHILCALEAKGDAEDEARRLGIAVWKKADLEREIGQAIVTRMGLAEDSAFKGLVGDKAMAEGASMLIESVDDGSKPCMIKSRLSIEDVEEISKKTIRGFKHELELVPHYIFQYSCSYIGRDEQPIQKSGFISVNALTGKYATWEHDAELEEDTGPRVQLEPKIDSESAQKIAVHAIISLNTEFKEVIVERDHATIIEKAKFKPEEKDIVLEKQNIVMVPVWCVEGKHGVMILDGITGKVISEDYYDSD